MSKNIEVNSPYFMSIHAAQNNIPEGDVALILSVLTPSCVVLRSVSVAVWVWVTILRCFKRLQSIVSMSKKIYENFVGTLGTIRNRELSVLVRCPYREFRLHKKRWLSFIVRSGFKFCSECLPVLPLADISS